MYIYIYTIYAQTQIYSLKFKLPKFRVCKLSIYMFSAQQG